MCHFADCSTSPVPAPEPGAAGGELGRIKNLGVIVNMLMEENAALKKRVHELEEENRALRDGQKGVFEKMQEDEKKLCFYTGLPDLAAFLLVLRMSVLVGFTKFKAMSPADTLLVILMKLRLGTTNMDLAYRFDVNPRYISDILRVG